MEKIPRTKKEKDKKKLTSVKDKLEFNKLHIHQVLGQTLMREAHTDMFDLH